MLLTVLCKVNRLFDYRGITKVNEIDMSQAFAFLNLARVAVLTR